MNDEDSDGDGIGGSCRLSACALAQRMLSRSRRSLLVFDEAEDVFPHEVFAMFGMHRHSTDQKSWTHRLLEETPVPTIWITNRVAQINPATLRRFLAAIELRTPPKAVRERMIQRRLVRTPVNAGWVERVAADERFTPADADRVARIARLLGRRPPEQLTQTLTHAVDGSLALAGPARALMAPASPTPYALRFVNASVDLEVLAQALTSNARGTICLYGPPGTGKTAFVQHVAGRIGRPLHSVHGSDLLNMYVGGTEQNVARASDVRPPRRPSSCSTRSTAFCRTARVHHARGRSRRSSEEPLVQIENFSGLLFCATNLVDSLDAASLEALRAEDPLRPAPTGAAARPLRHRGGHRRRHGPRAPQSDERVDGRRLRRGATSPGAAGRGSRPESLVRALAEEWTMKRRTTRSVQGFRSSRVPQG